MPAGEEQTGFEPAHVRHAVARAGPEPRPALDGAGKVQAREQAAQSRLQVPLSLGGGVLRPLSVFLGRPDQAEGSAGDHVHGILQVHHRVQAVERGDQRELSADGSQVRPPAQRSQDISCPRTRRDHGDGSPEDALGAGRLPSGPVVLQRDIAAIGENRGARAHGRVQEGRKELGGPEPPFAPEAEDAPVGRRQGAAQSVGDAVQARFRPERRIRFALHPVAESVTSPAGREDAPVVALVQDHGLPRLPGQPPHPPGIGRKRQGVEHAPGHVGPDHAARGQDPGGRGGSVRSGTVALEHHGPESPRGQFVGNGEAGDAAPHHQDVAPLGNRDRVHPGSTDSGRPWGRRIGQERFTTWTSSDGTRNGFRVPNRQAGAP